MMKNPKRTSRFHVVVEAADRLTLEEQETLVTVLNRRLADRRRAELARDIREAQREFERGTLRPTSPDEIMKEILSRSGSYFAPTPSFAEQREFSGKMRKRSRTFNLP
jgi:hypothetical protein